MVHQVFNDAFEALLSGWHRYMELAAATDDNTKLAEAANEICALRQRADRLQRAKSVDEGELEERDLATYCPFIRTTVYIPNNEISYTRDDVLTFVCACEREVGHRPKAWSHDDEDFGAKTGDYESAKPTPIRRSGSPSRR